MKLHPLFPVVAAAAGCAGPSNEPAESALDRTAPRVQIESPVRGTVAGDVTYVLVTGTASDDSGVVTAVTVNGVPAEIDHGGAWRAHVAVAPGTSLLHAIAFDAEDNRGEQTRAVVAGSMVGLDRRIEHGIRGTLSAPALLTMGHRTAAFIEAGGLMPAVQGMNPVVDAGSRTDCVHGQASITSVTAGDADVLMGPTNGGIMVSAVLSDVRVGMHLQWAFSCAGDSRDIVVSADRVTVQGLLAVGVVDRALDIQLEDSNVQIKGFDPQLAGVPQEVVQMLGLDAAISRILGSMTERVVVPMVARSLAPLDDRRTIDVSGIQIDIDVAPTQTSFSPRGGAITLDTSFRAHGDNGAFVFVPNSVWPLEIEHGFELAVADDAANQLLTSMWSIRAFDSTTDFEPSSSAIGKLYDSVQLQLAAPPHIHASARPLELTIGDWIATFKQGNDVAATVAIHAKAALYVIEGDDAALRMALGTPAITIDLLGEGDRITKIQHDAIKAFAAERVAEVGSAVVGAIPLPVIGEVMPNLWVEPESGSMLILGDVK